MDVHQKGYQTVDLGQTKDGVELSSVGGGRQAVVETEIRVINRTTSDDNSR